MLPLPEARFSLQGLISSWHQSYDVASFSCPHLPGEDTGETSSQAEALAWLLREMHPPHPMLTLYLQSNPESQIRGSSHIPRAEEYTWDSKLPRGGGTRGGNATAGELRAQRPASTPVMPVTPALALFHREPSL